jgi:hypothetical protein
MVAKSLTRHSHFHEDMKWQLLFLIKSDSGSADGHAFFVISITVVLDKRGKAPYR